MMRLEHPPLRVMSADITRGSALEAVTAAEAATARAKAEAAAEQTAAAAEAASKPSAVRQPSSHCSAVSTAVAIFLRA